MSGYFGNAVTATLDGAAIGQLKTMQLPEVNFDTEDFTGLGDTHEDLCMVPIQSATEFEMTFALDESVTAHRTIEALVGSNTGVNLVITFPWATNNTYTQSVVVKTLGSADIEPKGEVIRPITFLTKAAGVWSTV